MSDRELMTLEEVSKYLRVSERTVYDWANKGEIPCGKLGTTWRFKRTEIERYVDRKLGANRPMMHFHQVGIADVLSPDRVILLKKANKAEVLEALVAALAKAPQVHDKGELLREVNERERLMSTGIGFGIGVPHVRLSSIDDLVLAVAVTETPITDYESLDEKPVRIICMVAARDDQHAQYLKMLARISTVLKSEQVRNAMLAAKKAGEIYDILCALH
jgi:PTS system nitrogen regulatory IIA component